MKVASQRFSTRVGFRPVSLFYLNGSRTLREPHASVDRVNVDIYTFSIIASKFVV